MKKILLFLFMFTTALTIIYAINGKTFNFKNYFEEISVEMQDLESPNFPNIKFQAMSETREELWAYRCYIRELIGSDLVYFKQTDDGIYKVYYFVDTEITCGQYNSLTGGYSDGIITKENYDEIPIEARDSLYPIYREENEEITIVSFVNWLIQPFRMLFELIRFLIQYLVYVFKIIYIVGGGLIC